MAGSSRVLVVDDNCDAADGMAAWLQLAGHDVRTAYEGLDALAVAVDFRPSIVLLDIGLPGTDGHELARRLRQIPELKNVWLIAVTGYGRTADIQSSEEAGFDYHLVKPTDTQKLKTLLASLSDKVRSGH